MLTQRHTRIAAHLAVTVQAAANSFLPLLFVTFQSEFCVTLAQLASLVTLNFFVQLMIDILAARFSARFTPRTWMVAAHSAMCIGFLLLTVLPALLPAPFVGLLCATVLCAAGSGLIEIFASPIIESLPCKESSAALSLLHSFYCGGQVAVIALSAAFFFVFGTAHWRIPALFWSMLPLGNALLFACVPIPNLESAETATPRALLRDRSFHLLFLMMLCAGAAEYAIGQWASLFAERALGVSKMLGDLLGPCLFALMMGASRLWYALRGKGRLLRAMCVCSVLCVISHLVLALSPLPLVSLAACGLCGLAIGIFWPGIFSLCAACCRGGASMFAMLAIGGDIGCTLGPALVGFVAQQSGGDLRAGMLAALGFSVFLFSFVFLWKVLKKPCNLKKE